jgi:hypothetical protein
MDWKTVLLILQIITIVLNAVSLIINVRTQKKVNMIEKVLVEHNWADF